MTQSVSISARVESQPGRETDQQSRIRWVRQAERQRDGQTYKRRYIQAVKEMDDSGEETDRRTYEDTDRQTVKKTDQCGGKQSVVQMKTQTDR